MTATVWATMGDAAFAPGLFGTHFDAVAGYLSSGHEVNPWSVEDWQGVVGPKLPIWVAGFNGKMDAESCLNGVWTIGATKGCYVAVDMEARVDETYVAAFGAIMQHEGYKVLVYGSASTVFNHPQLNGYWVADYAGIGPFMYNHPGVRATQYQPGPNYDSSTVRPWILPGFWV